MTEMSQGKEKPRGMQDLIPAGTRSVCLNDRKLIYLLLSCGFLFSVAMDYKQKCEACSNLCVTILINRTEINCIYSYLRANRRFCSNELEIGIVFCDVIITFLDNSWIV